MAAPLRCFRPGAPPRARWIAIGPGRATLGIDRGAAEYVWDNEAPHHAVAVPGFTIQSGNVTNAAFMDFVEAGVMAASGSEA